MTDETQSFTAFSMSNCGESHQIPARSEPPARLPGFVTGDILQRPLAGGDPCVPLLNLSTVRARMDSLQRFLSDKVQGNALIGQDQMAMVSTEIAAAIQQIIVNGAALLACSQTPIQYEESTRKPLGESDLKVSEGVGNENATAPATTADSMCKSRGKGVASPTGDTMDEDAKDEIGSEEWEIIEMDAVELLAEHVHFCEVCGKGFKRDANLRMHMRAHGNQFKTPEALAKPAGTCAAESRRRARFSCPFEGCNRNRKHSKFRALKSAICVKNHFKRSHCPKIYSCTGCNKKTFSVLADLKSHLKHCGKSKWNCSCGTSFSRKDKLFGHMALFEGHAPAVAEAEAALMTEDEEEEELQAATEMEVGANGLFEGLLEGFGSIENHRLQDVLGYPDTSLATDLGDFYNFS